MRKPYRVEIERYECIVCGSCWAICPDVFEENDDDGFSQIVVEYQLNGDVGIGEVPETLAECVTDASNVCPVDIIHVQEED
jgi:ferredoxin